MIVKAGLTDKDENGLEGWHREMVMCDLIGVIEAGLRSSDDSAQEGDQ